MWSSNSRGLEYGQRSRSRIIKSQRITSNVLAREQSAESCLAGLRNDRCCGQRRSDRSYPWQIWNNRDGTVSWPPRTHTAKPRYLYSMVTTPKPPAGGLLTTSANSMSSRIAVSPTASHPISKLLTLVPTISLPTYQNKMPYLLLLPPPHHHRRQDHPCRRAHRLHMVANQLAKTTASKEAQRDRATGSSS